MNDIIEFSINESGELEFTYKNKVESIAAAGTTIEDTCQSLLEAFQYFKAVFPQSEDYEAYAVIRFKGQGSHGEQQQIQATLSRIPSLNIISWDVKTHCYYLDCDTEYLIELHISNIINYDEQLVTELLKKANANDESAVHRLGCDPEGFSDVHTLCPSSDEEFSTEMFVFHLFVDSAGSVPHLYALAAAFLHGLVVEKDRHMAAILVDCANKAMEMYTEEEREERECWFDPEMVQYYFLGQTPSDRQYVLDWIEKQSHSDTIFQAQAEMLMGYYYKSSSSSSGM